jgi:hypothetical protein
MLSALLRPAVMAQRLPTTGATYSNVCCFVHAFVHLYVHSFVQLFVHQLSCPYIIFLYLGHLARPTAACTLGPAPLHQTPRWRSMLAKFHYYSY